MYITSLPLIISLRERFPYIIFILLIYAHYILNASNITNYEFILDFKRGRDTISLIKYSFDKIFFRLIKVFKKFHVIFVFSWCSGVDYNSDVSKLKNA